jgi:hypothetical protein
MVSLLGSWVVSGDVASLWLECLPCTYPTACSRTVISAPYRCHCQHHHLPLQAVARRWGSGAVSSLLARLSCHLFIVVPRSLSSLVCHCPSFVVVPVACSLSLSSLPVRHPSSVLCHSSLLSLWSPVVVEDSTNDPPRKQWLARLVVMVGSLIYYISYV